MVALVGAVAVIRVVLGVAVDRVIGMVVLVKACGSGSGSSKDSGNGGGGCSNAGGIGGSRVLVVVEQRWQ
jgi:hypothetical protein